MLIFSYSAFVHNLHHEFWQALHNSLSFCFASLFFSLSSWCCVGEMALLDAAWTYAPKIPTVSFPQNWQICTFFPVYSIHRCWTCMTAIQKQLPKLLRSTILFPSALKSSYSIGQIYLYLVCCSFRIRVQMVWWTLTLFLWGVGCVEGHVSHL
jgi:hypothetical protein